MVEVEAIVGTGALLIVFSLILAINYGFYLLCIAIPDFIGVLIVALLWFGVDLFIIGLVILEASESK